MNPAAIASAAERTANQGALAQSNSSAISGSIKCQTKIDTIIKIPAPIEILFDLCIDSGLPCRTMAANNNIVAITNNTVAVIPP